MHWRTTIWMRRWSVACSTARRASVARSIAPRSCFASRDARRNALAARDRFRAREVRLARRQQQRAARRATPVSVAAPGRPQANYRRPRRRRLRVPRQGQWANPTDEYAKAPSRRVGGAASAPRRNPGTVRPPRGTQPHPATELVYSTPFELLVAVILSASGDRRRRQQGDPRPVCSGKHAGAHACARRRRPQAHIASIGLYNTKAANVIAMCRRLLEEHAGEVPRTREALEALPVSVARRRMSYSTPRRRTHHRR